MAESDTIKPCPFCGGAAKEWEEFDDGAAYMRSSMAASYHVGCIRCKANIRGYKTAGDVVAAWNNRITEGRITQ